MWHGVEFSKARELHETGRYDEIPICKECNRWASNTYEEEVVNNILVRRSPEYIYYNRLDRIKNWSQAAHGAHEVNSID